MEDLKIPHNQFGDHHPLEGKPILTDPYELKGAKLKYIGHELNRASTHICWEDTATERRYRSDVYLLQAALSGELKNEAEVKFGEEGLYVAGRFGFEQKGNHVLLILLPPVPNQIDKDFALNFAKETFEAVLSGKLSLRHVKVHARAFLEYLKAENNGKI